MKLPDSFELPRPEDFCKGKWVSGNRCCTMLWISRLGLCQVRTLDAWNRAADEVGIPTRLSISFRTDHPDTTHEQLAEAFELMAVKLGYEIEEPVE